jgi:hypothetical protein
VRRDESRAAAANGVSKQKAASRGVCRGWLTFQAIVLEFRFLHLIASREGESYQGSPREFLIMNAVWMQLIAESQQVFSKAQ